MHRFSIINFIIFQSCWALAASFPASAPFFMIGLLGVHFVLTPTRKADGFLLIAALAGILVDQFMVWIGILEVDQPWIPIWLILLWGHFILCLNHSLLWLSKLAWYWVAFLGEVFGTLSYWSGLKLGVFNTELSQPSFILSYAIAWTILLPILSYWAKITRERYILK
ncbi:DUF2878 domain-containing protein [Vibrio algivorus]|uniref:DUF2878 domain-containing protein n=1 Tax=Vibrio algivorus TaxID=1667024 RepID=A0A557PB08_9VIBR|nr:DUF2878 domain-containing protein [Vibrio algivorus]TVO37833.1 DUF2878 domain-containing protein [Vibrio algivorus]